MSNGTQEFPQDSLLVSIILGCVLLYIPDYMDSKWWRGTQKASHAIKTSYFSPLCHLLLIPLFCSLSNDRLFLKLSCSYLLFFCPITTDSVIAYIMLRFFCARFNFVFLYYF